MSIQPRILVKNLDENVRHYVGILGLSIAQCLETPLVDTLQSTAIATFSVFPWMLSYLAGEGYSGYRYGRWGSGPRHRVWCHALSLLAHHVAVGEWLISAMGRPTTADTRRHRDYSLVHCRF